MSITGISRFAIAILVVCHIEVPPFYAEMPLNIG